MFLPYNIVYSQSDDGTTYNTGLGDLTLMGNFNLLEKIYLNRDTASVLQQLWIGGGLKVPTGKFTVDPGAVVTSANMQPGTGSLDYVVNLMYAFQVKSWGYNFTSNYRINEAANNYRFGNRLNLTAFVFRTFHIGSFSISPNVGMLHEILAANMNHHEKVADTGGHILMAATGIEVMFKNVVFGCNDQIPLSSDLSGGQTDAKIRGMCHLSYMF